MPSHTGMVLWGEVLQSGSFLKVVPTGVSDRVDVKCEGTEEIEDDFYKFYLSS